MEIVVAYADYQLYAFRNVIYLGVLIGILLKLPAMDQKTTQNDRSVVPRKPIRISKVVPLDLLEASIEK